MFQAAITEDCNQFLTLQVFKGFYREDQKEKKKKKIVLSFYNQMKILN